MAFTPIDSTEVEAGKSTTSTLGEKIRTNFNDHESRLSAVESGTNTVYPPMIFRVNGPYYYNGAATGIVKTTLNFNITITGIRLLIDSAGSSGTTQVDLKYKRGAGSYTSVLTTKPSVGYSSGDDAISTNAVLNPSESTLQAGDILRLDLTSVQDGGRSFTVRVDYNRA